MDRRLFLTTSVSTGLLALNQSMKPDGTASAAELAGTELTKANIPTPALIVDLDALEANLQKMADHCRQAKCSFRPHAKTHKCPEIARRQLASGAVGISVATVSEAEAMAAARVEGILLTSPIVDPSKIARLVELVRSGTKIIVAVGHSHQADLLAAAAEAAGVIMDVLVDLDVGDKRTGALPGEPAVELARKIGLTRRLRVRGVQAYAGHASHTVGFEDRQRVSRIAMLQAVQTQRMLERAGIEAQIVSGGSTGTYNIDSAIDGVTELQVGSYVFMDLDYRRIGGRERREVYDDFQHSLTVLTTVVSATHSDRVTVDAGTKAIDTTTPHRAEAKNWPGLVYNRAGDEFGTLTTESGAKLPAIGDRLEFIVPHCDPSVNLYDRLFVSRGNRVEAIWPIVARREVAPVDAARSQ
jgi:3-hydroxy-D-aspartate aldolase